MTVDMLSFGKIVLDGKTYDHDLVIDRGEIGKRKKGESKPLKGRYGHTPLTPRENIPWDCRRLVIGTGMSEALPVTDELREEADRLGVELQLMPTPDAAALLEQTGTGGGTNFVLHLTC